MPLKTVFSRPQNLVSTKTLLLKHYYRRLGKKAPIGAMSSQIYGSKWQRASLFTFGDRCWLLLSSELPKSQPQGIDIRTKLVPRLPFQMPIVSHLVVMRIPSWTKRIHHDGYSLELILSGPKKKQPKHKVFRRDIPGTSGTQTSGYSGQKLYASGLFLLF